MTLTPVRKIDHRVTAPTSSKRPHRADHDGGADCGEHVGIDLAEVQASLGCRKRDGVHAANLVAPRTWQCDRVKVPVKACHTRHMPGMNLTKSEAQERSAVVSNTNYTVSWDFTDEGDRFRTSTRISFDTPDGASTFLDCAAEEVTRIVLNGTELDPRSVVSTGRIALENLRAHNEVEIDAAFAYRVDGQGIHRFIDPEDGEVYLYSQFAAVDARAAFPCFDQPDIRGTFAITVTAPARWHVVSNYPSAGPQRVAGAATSVGGIDDAVHRWSFETTPALPTYVAAVVAGPYAYESGTLLSRKGEIPTRVFGRKNLASHLDADEMIATVQAGINLYERVFDTEYPYAKYDQIFVPEYNLGAMENVGCVTFSEDRLLFRSRPSQALRQQRVNIVLHELSHMWFGNLVTMRWWDDLWLNESFAEFVGTWATEQATPWTDAWVTFGASRKSVAYIQDQLPTTHAIVTEIPDVEATVSAFDMITYAKGAAALKQLAAYVGEDAFFGGVATYLKRYAFGNATLAEFLAEVEKSAGTDLGPWASAWLETPGATTLRPVVEADDAGLITSFAVAEDVPEAFPTHRPHRITIAGYRHREGTFERAWAADASLTGALTAVEDVVGRERADLILVNDLDRTYAKTRLDETSLDTVTGYIAHLTEPMALASVLDSLWHMCRDAHLPAEHYIDAVLTAMPQFTNSETAESHLRTLAVALSRYVSPARTHAVGEAVAERLWEILESAAPGSDLQLQAVQGFARFAATPTQGARLADLLDGADRHNGLEVDTDLAWDLLTGMVAVGAGGRGSIAARLAQDPGAIGQRRAAGAQAAIGKLDAKQTAWESLVRPAAPVPNAVQYEIAAGLARAVDPAMMAPLATTILDDLRAYYEANEGWVGARVARSVFPTWATGRVDALDTRIERWLADNADAPSVLIKIVTEGLDDVRRAMAAQAVA